MDNVVTDFKHLGLDIITEAMLIPPNLLSSSWDADATSFQNQNIDYCRNTHFSVLCYIL